MTASGATLFEALWRLKDLRGWLRPERLKSAMQRASLGILVQVSSL